MRYEYNDTLIHRLSPSVKMIYSVLVSLSAAVSNSPPRAVVSDGGSAVRACACPPRSAQDTFPVFCRHSRNGGDRRHPGAVLFS